jgi:hypothetical protein
VKTAFAQGNGRTYTSRRLAHGRLLLARPLGLPVIVLDDPSGKAPYLEREVPREAIKVSITLNQTPDIRPLSRPPKYLAAVKAAAPPARRKTACLCDFPRVSNIGSMPAIQGIS